MRWKASIPSLASQFSLQYRWIPGHVVDQSINKLGKDNRYWSRLFVLCISLDLRAGLTGRKRNSEVVVDLSLFASFYYAFVTILRLTRHDRRMPRSCDERFFGYLAHLSSLSARGTIDRQLSFVSSFFSLRIPFARLDHTSAPNEQSNRWRVNSSSTNVFLTFHHKAYQSAVLSESIIVAYSSSWHSLISASYPVLVPDKGLKNESISHLINTSSIGLKRCLSWHFAFLIGMLIEALFSMTHQKQWDASFLRFAFSLRLTWNTFFDLLSDISLHVAKPNGTSSGWNRSGSRANDARRFQAS